MLTLSNVVSGFSSLVSEQCLHCLFKAALGRKGHSTLLVTLCYRCIALYHLEPAYEPFPFFTQSTSCYTPRSANQAPLSRDLLHLPTTVSFLYVTSSTTMEPSHEAFPSHSQSSLCYTSTCAIEALSSQLGPTLLSRFLGFRSSPTHRPAQPASSGQGGKESMPHENLSKLAHLGA